MYFFAHQLSYFVLQPIKLLFLNPSVQLTWALYVHREPDSTYFELPPGSHTGERPVPSTSTPGSHHNTAEGSMDVYHLRDTNDNVMVGTWASSKFISYHFVVEHVSLSLLKRSSFILLAVFPSPVSDHIFLVGPQWHFNFSEANEQNKKKISCCLIGDGKNLFTSLQNVIL